MGLKGKFNFAEINYALCLARGFQCPVDWRTADQLVRQVSSPQDLVKKWWYPIAQSGDPEGHLVLGWLARHRLVVDPEGWHFTKRLETARSGGWDLPDWLFESVA
jgi:hypothetical protein